jgi:hypothetical protein
MRLPSSQPMGDAVTIRPDSTTLPHQRHATGNWRISQEIKHAEAQDAETDRRTIDHTTARITADRLVQHLEASGFVLMKGSVP